MIMLLCTILFTKIGIQSNLLSALEGMHTKSVLNLVEAQVLTKQAALYNMITIES